MKKIFLELVLTVSVIVLVWFGLSKVDWMKVLNIRQSTQNTEAKIGDFFWNLMKQSDTEITADSVSSTLDSMLYRICTANSIDSKKIKLHLLKKAEINAFALPGNHLVIYSGLISACENEAELYGVICHELAHIEKNHVMDRLIKEIGLSVLISMAGGNGNAESIKLAIKQLTSNAYDRKLESEADLTALEYLEKAEINPAAFADFLYRLADETKMFPNQIDWISTHPESKKRANKILENIHKKSFPEPDAKALERFERLKEKVGEN